MTHVIDLTEILKEALSELKKEELEADGYPALTDCNCLGCRLLKQAKEGKMGRDEYEEAEQLLKLLQDGVNGLQCIPVEEFEKIVTLAKELNQPVMAEVAGYFIGIQITMRQYALALKAEGGAK